jgi:glyoxylase-like metal-dependent hydrolase (beta-lactamase superfamily II)
MKIPTLLTAMLAFGAMQAPASARETPPSVSETTLRSPGAYQFLLGDFRVVALTDGTVSIPLDRLLHGAPTAAEIFRAAGQTPDRPTSINAYLIDTGTRRILIDTGAGGLFGDCCGRLPETLAAAGYPVETIDAVLLTHVHGDHSGGLTRDGVRVFPKAEIYLDARELDYWMSDAARDAAKPAHRHGFDQGRAALTPYQAAGRVKAFDQAGLLFDGVRAIAAPGHTPGHVFYEIESRGRRLRIIGDLIHAAEVQMADPSVTIDYDLDEPQAAATRQAALAELADDRILTAAPHISFPGLGHVYRRAQAYAWSPLPYAYAVRQEGGTD